MTKLGRPSLEPLHQLRTLFWYHAIRSRTGMRDAELDLTFHPDERKYIDRVRMFEHIRRTGCTITNGTHRDRKFKLIDVVDKHHGLSGSKAFYEARFWKVATEKKFSLESTTEELINAIDLCNLWENPIGQFEKPTKIQSVFILSMFGVDKSTISDVLEEGIETEKREIYDNILFSFGSVIEYSELKNKVSFDLFNKFLNKLYFLTVLYRYALLTGNFHALIAAADNINEHTSLLLLEFDWIDKNLTRKLFYEIQSSLLDKKNSDKDLAKSLSLKNQSFNLNDKNMALSLLIDHLTY